MPPLQRLIFEADEVLTEHGYESLSRTDGSIGVDRHGLWDFTWINDVSKRRSEVLAVFASVARSGDYAVEIWRGDVVGSEVRRHRVDRFRLPTDDELETMKQGGLRHRRTLRRIVAAAEAAIPSDDASARRRLVPAAPRREPRAAREGWRGAVLEVFERERHPMRNRDVLSALVRAGWALPEDSALVARALWTLERDGLLTRPTRGVYQLSE